MEWVNSDHELPIKSWCREVEEGSLEQAINLANHPAVSQWVSLMPDCHKGYGMPIGGVVMCPNHIIPNGVGVDIGCGVTFAMSNTENKLDKSTIRKLLKEAKKAIPVGEGHAHKEIQIWHGFAKYAEHEEILWFTEDIWELAQRNLGTLGGGNHFIEIDVDKDNNICLLIHSGSRNLGYKIATYHNSIAKDLNKKWLTSAADDLAFFPIDSDEGQRYITDMSFAKDYAKENRKIMMEVMKEILSTVGVTFTYELDVPHNYVDLINCNGKNGWVHRKGAISARKNEVGVIPGSMGTSSFIVKGLGNSDSFMSCSHGAGRNCSRTKAIQTLSVGNCNEAMGDIVFDRWNKIKKGKNKGLFDVAESPLAYKNIDEVIDQELDLITPINTLSPIGVLKG